MLHQGARGWHCNPQQTVWLENKLSSCIFSISVKSGDTIFCRIQPWLSCDEILVISYHFRLSLQVFPHKPASGCHSCPLIPVTLFNSIIVRWFLSDCLWGTWSSCWHLTCFTRQVMLECSWANLVPFGTSSKYAVQHADVTWRVYLLESYIECVVAALSEVTERWEVHGLKDMFWGESRWTSLKLSSGIIVYLATATSAVPSYRQAPRNPASLAKQMWLLSRLWTFPDSCHKLNSQTQDSRYSFSSSLLLVSAQIMFCIGLERAECHPSCWPPNFKGTSVLGDFFLELATTAVSTWVLDFSRNASRSH